MPIIDRDKQLDHLFSRVENYLSYTWKKHKLNKYINFVVVVAGLLVSVSIAYVGLKAAENSQLAGSLGILMTILVGLQGAFKFGDKAIHYVNLHTEAKDIRDQLYYEADGPDDVVQISRQFMALRKKGAESLPKDENLASIVQSSDG